MCKDPNVVSGAQILVLTGRIKQYRMQLTLTRVDTYELRFTMF
jgi:hypothetical protein